MSWHLQCFKVQTYGSFPPHPLRTKSPVMHILPGPLAEPADQDLDQPHWHTNGETIHSTKAAPGAQISQGWKQYVGLCEFSTNQPNTPNLGTFKIKATLLSFPPPLPAIWIKTVNPELSFRNSFVIHLMRKEDKGGVEITFFHSAILRRVNSSGSLCYILSYTGVQVSPPALSPPGTLHTFCPSGKTSGVPKVY